MPRPLFIACLLLTLLLNACRGAGQPIQPTPTGTPTLSPLSTSTPTPTLEAGMLSSAAQGTRVTPRVFPPENTPAPGEQERLERLFAKATPHPLETSVAPDGRWEAEVQSFGCVDIGNHFPAAYDLMLVSDRDFSEIIIDRQFRFCGAPGAAGLSARFWSADSRYFYYTNTREGVLEDACGVPYPMLLRYEPASGLKEALGLTSVSPDGRLLAVLQSSDLLVLPVDAAEGTRFSLADPALRSRAIAWSPDPAHPQALVYLLNPYICAPSRDHDSWVVRVDASTGAESVLVQSRSPGFTAVEWRDPGALRLVDTAGRTWRYTFDDGQLAPQ